MSFYDGRVLYVKISSVWTPVGCLTSNSLDESVEMLPTTTRQDNGWTSARPTRQSAGIAFEGLQVLTVGDGADTTKASYDWLKTTKRARTLVEWKIEDANTTFIDEGFGYITQIGEASAVGDFLSFSGTLQVFGEPVFTTQVGTYIFQDGDTYLFQDGAPFLFN